MKKVTILLLSVFALMACNNPKSDNSQNETETTHAIGGDKDEHGCLTAAGETWSQLKQDCVRLFEIGVRLNPTNPKEDEAIISAFALFSDDKSQVELFVSDTENSIILDATSDDVYESGEYKFDASTMSMYLDDVLTYEANDSESIEAE